MDTPLNAHQREARERLRAVLANYNLLDPIHGLGRDVDEAVRWALGALAAPTPTDAAALSRDEARESPLAHAAVEKTAKAHGWDEEGDTLAGWLHRVLTQRSRDEAREAPDLVALVQRWQKAMRDYRRDGVPRLVDTQAALLAWTPAAPSASKTEEMAEWGDAVAALEGCPGTPPPEAIDRLVKAGDALASMLRVPAAPSAAALRLVERFRFESFQHWVTDAHAMPWDYINDTAINTCVDAKGRICRVGSDFERAAREDAYPVVAYAVVEAPAAPSAAPDETVRVSTLEGVTVAGARAFWRWKDESAAHERLRADVMTVYSDPSLTWEQARQKLAQALSAPSAPPEVETLRAELAAARAALDDLVQNANRLCDRQLGGTYEDDCNLSIRKARAVLAGSAPTGEKGDARG